ncbi:uncharacterized protein LOC127242873 [Andrographis paniculata]|uniref:uncharacterized protein LOC127242873 n=1 Tax=Andrographis paniculata TaxID=175694 RepID=UPI0021E87E70|nr:uncharacterized protein LOC127242873 [Andrographis paniculata]
MDLDLPLHIEKPPAITDTSNEANNIKSTFPEIDDAKEFMKAVGECSQIADKSLAGTLMATLSTIKFDGSRSIHEHVVKMTNLAARLKALGINVDDNFLVQFILNSLPPEYGLFKLNYNIMKDKWNVNELYSMLVQEETWFKNQGSHSIHLITNQGVGRKVGNNKVKGKRGPLKVNMSSA